MPLSSWFSSHPPLASDTPSTTHTLNFDEIASSLETYQEQYQTVKNHLRQAQDDLTNCRKELGGLQKTLNRERSVNANLRKDNETRKKLSAQVGTAKTEVAAIKLTNERLTRDLADLQTAYDLLQEENCKLIKKFEGGQIDLSSLKQVSEGQLLPAVGDGAAMPLIPQPFVVVLIDGDAYSWTTNLFNPTTSSTSPGSQAATRLKTEVTRHILNSQTIPVTSKVIVRIFVNTSGKSTKSTRPFMKAKQQFRSLPKFMVDFNETMPLFDFVDVGQGKERADEKIRENFHLYLSNPHCHTIFAAICTDNGFARMLEPYQAHSSARDKIVLVSPGLVEREIERLGFSTVFWPSVFARQIRPMVSTKGQMRKALNENMRKAKTGEVEARNKDLELTGMKDEVLADVVLETVVRVGAWDVDEAIFRSRRCVGLRYRIGFHQEEKRPDVKEEYESELDDGVD